MSRPLDTDLSNIDLAKQLGLSSDEYSYICRKLERKPNFAELGVFSAMYSEHCSYKSSKKYLKRFPTEGARVLQGPGENAGVLDIGDGWAVAFKMESHNHPSYIEPYQGAATGVGGILRDVFTMGARPIASMDALCFGVGEDEKTKNLVRRVVKGIGDYGNCVGVPTIAGQTLFHPCYARNPLVNAFTLGVVPKDRIAKGIAKGKGNWVVYVGAKTGRDGVHGATMASQEFSTEKEPDRPTVQVGDPFTEKLLLEATLEVLGKNLTVGIQDMGAAGLTSSSFEMAHRGQSGMDLNLDEIPCRETAMSAYEMLLSESQERMLLVATPENLSEIVSIYEKWDLHAVCIGKVTDGNRVKMTKNGLTIVDIPIDLVISPPVPERPKLAPGDLKQRWFLDRNRLLSATLEAKFQSLFEDMNFAYCGALVEQYDSMVGNRTLGSVFSDSAVLRVREIENRSVRLAMTVDCNPRVCWLSPREGGRRAVAESALNLAVRGAEPIGLTDCLNFGSPENPEVMWQFEESIAGISETCETLKIPVISGNVSFYNDTDGKAIYPTPMIGMVGLIEDRDGVPHSSIFSTQAEIALLGPIEGGLGGTMLASQWFKRDCGKPEDTDLKMLERMLKFLKGIRKKKLELALHDVSDGGLVAAILEMAFYSPFECIGLELLNPPQCDTDGFLFGETVPRVLAAYDSIERVELEGLASQMGVTFTVIGNATDDSRFVLKQGGAKVWDFSMPALKTKWKNRWENIFG